jgi:hypothetical protein
MRRERRRSSWLRPDLRIEAAKNLSRNNKLYRTILTVARDNQLFSSRAFPLRQDM